MPLTCAPPPQADDIITVPVTIFVITVTVTVTVIIIISIIITVTITIIKINIIVTVVTLKFPRSPLRRRRLREDVRMRRERAPPPACATHMQKAGRAARMPVSHALLACPAYHALLA